MLQSCLGTRYLQKNEYLLADQYIIGNKKTNKIELTPYYLQSTNRKFLGIPFRLWIYQIGKYTYNKQFIKREYERIKLRYKRKLATLKENIPYKKLKKAKKKKLKNYKKLIKYGNFLMRMGEAPVIFVPQKRIDTENNLLQYLYTKGYFDAQVTSTVRFKDKRAYVFYRIKEDQPFLIKDTSLYTPDTCIKNLLQPYEQHSLLRKKDNYSQDMLVVERNRIYNILVNNGYFNFNKQYISFNVDTVASHQSVSIETVISLPEENISHPIYYIDNILFSVRSTGSANPVEEIITPNGIILENTKPYFLNNAIIAKIPVHSKQLYRKSDFTEIQRRFTSLGIFKNFRVGYEVIGDNLLSPYIRTSLLDKFQLEQELGTEFTRISTIPFYQLSFKSRNLFKRLDILTIKAQLNLETGSLPTSGEQFYSVQNFQLSMGIDLPQFVFLFPSRIDSKLDVYNPNTKLDVSYIFTNKDKYSCQKVETFLSYSWHPNALTRLEFIPISIGLMDFKIQEDFKKELLSRQLKGDNTYKRYDPAFLSSSCVRTIFKRSKEYTKKYWGLELFLESGGSFQNLIDFEKVFTPKLTYYKYIKCNLLYNHQIPLQSSTLFAYQFNTGIIYAYNKYKIAPPDKYYFIGGPNSIRGWSSKTLGPGSSYSDNSQEEKFFKEKPGEFIIQGSLELRQHLIGFLEGAFFIDIGNIWMLQKTSEDGADFDFSRFYKEIAISSGLGIRLNFDFLIVRVDVGVKIYDPASLIGFDNLLKNIFEPTVNFGLGYPF